MRKLLLSVIAGMLLVLGTGTAQAAPPPAPTNLGGGCGEPHLLYWTPSAGATHYNIYHELKPIDAAAFNAPQFIGQPTSSAVFFETPQADVVRYTVKAANGDGESAGVQRTCDSDIRYASGAETTPTFGYLGEWATFSAQSSARVSRVTTPRLKGLYAYKCFLQEGDNSSGERCEYSQGNTSESNIHTEKVYHEGDDLWVAFAVYIPNPGFLFCQESDDCSELGDGGSIDQTKQLGSCGTPAGSIPAYNKPTTGLYLRQSVSDDNICENATMDEIWRANISFNTWTKVLRRIKFSPSKSVGFYETFIDADGDAVNDFVAVPASEDGLDKPRTNVTETILGQQITVERITTHTMKTPTDQPDPACTGEWCSHQRVGVYRGGNTARITGNSTVYHDGIVAGPTVDNVINAAF